MCETVMNHWTVGVFRAGPCLSSTQMDSPPQDQSTGSPNMLDLDQLVQKVQDVQDIRGKMQQLQEERKKDEALQGERQTKGGLNTETLFLELE